MKIIDNFLNSITMYRLVLYSLCCLAAVSIIFSVFGLISYPPLGLISSLVILLVSCFFSNIVFSKLFNAQTNLESPLISALILFFILNPAFDASNIGLIFLVGIVAMGSKYVFAIGKKHIFNPVAIALVIFGLLGIGNAYWWVATPILTPLTSVIAFLVLKKLRRGEMFASFALSALLMIEFFAWINKVSFIDTFYQAFTAWPLLFFGSIMLTEPLTTPPTKKLQLIYGSLVGFVFGFQIHVGPIYPTPEMALVIGNIFSYIVSPKQKLTLTLKNKEEIAQNTYEFSFQTDKKLNYQAGQYLELTLSHKNSDTRGNRRYFTIASSPLDSEVDFGIKFSDPSSSFKKELLSFKEGDKIMAASLAGDFVLPKNIHQRLVFIAGGIGITPFVSFLEYLLGKKEQREIVLFYSNTNEKDIAYKPLLDRAEKELGVKVIYLLHDKPQANLGNIEIGHIDEEMINKYVKNMKECMYYLSGPNAMVESYKKLIKKLGVSGTKIVTDYFPGY